MIVRRFSTGGPWIDLQKFTRRFRSAQVSGRKNGATVIERTRTMASAEAAKRLGLLIRNQTTTMGLDNFPKQCGCHKHPYDPILPKKGTTHNPGEPCPFEKDEFPKGMLGTCCSLRGKVAADELKALGETHTSANMYKDMSAESAATFSKELRLVADILERRHTSDADRPQGAGWNGLWNDETKSWEYQKYSTFEDALASVREAARWYEKVAELGFGVHAWF